jgi:hypothetical protein
MSIIVGAGLAANGIWMLASPQNWYGFIPGVASTGLANLHFIRDIGCAYLMAGGSLFWLAKAPRKAWPAAFVGAGFLALHALVHVWDTTAGRESAHQLLIDVPAVVLPAAVAYWLAARARHDTGEE